MNEDLKIIKEKYGEKMMHLCRELFSTLLEEDGLLSKLMLENFAPSKFLYDDIINVSNVESFKNYIYSLVDVEEKDVEVLKTPYELLDQARYILYECKSEEDIQGFKKYYSTGEELCTFRGGRLNNCHVFFAIKKNVDEIKRENYANPERQDEYGTSVISIQFTRGKVNTLSIKNRYNHTVNNPDATYSNNLDNIVLGLTKSFEQFYNLNINQNNNNGYEIQGYVKANDGRYYKYNYEINNRYYCPDNIIIEHFEVIHLPKEKYIVLDYFVLCLVEKKLILHDENITDSFIHGIKDIEKINIVKNKENGNKQIEIITKEENKIIIEIDKFNRIVGYKNSKLKNVGDSFLSRNKFLNKLELPSLKSVDDHFLCQNESLQELNLPNLEYIGSSFLRNNKILKNIYLPKIYSIGNSFLRNNNKLENISFMNLHHIGDHFLSNNKVLKTLDLPKLVFIDDNFLECCESLEKINLPEVKKVGFAFLAFNKNLVSVELPNLEIAESRFMTSNRNLEYIYLPKLKFVYDNFLTHNEKLTKLDLPSLQGVGDDFLYHNKKLMELNVPELISIGNYFLHSNLGFININLPKLILIRKYILGGEFKILKNIQSENSLYGKVIKQTKKSNRTASIILMKLMNLRDRLKEREHNR